MAKSPSSVALEHQSAVKDLNDLAYFVSVVKHQGFSAAARATGIEKTRLSRRIAALEARLGVRLLARSTRSLALTEAGQRFHAHSLAAVEAAEAAYEGIADLRREPSGTVRMTCPQVMAESYLAPILPGYLSGHPKVTLVLEATNREVNLLEERFDLALRAGRRMEETPGLVAQPVATGRRILVASPGYLARTGCPEMPRALSAHDTLGRPEDLSDGQLRWDLLGSGGDAVSVRLAPRVLANDLRLLHEAACQGIGIALLPEPIVVPALGTERLLRVLPDWAGVSNPICLLSPTPRGLLPSVRSLIDYLMEYLPASIQGRPSDPQPGDRR
jgi:DNA-binding transcriptional LysR family regulator